MEAQNSCPTVKRAGARAMETRMSTNNEPMPPVAVLKAPKTSLALIRFARKVHSAFVNNPTFPNPVPTLSVLETHIDEFEDAESKAACRTEGAVAFRDARKRRLQKSFVLLRAYVQSVVSDGMTPAEAIAAIESAYMSVKKTATRSIPEVSVKSADISGKVRLAAKAVASKALYVWEYSVDQSKWTPLPETLKSRTELSGLTPECVYYFRFRAFTHAGWQGYSPVVSFLVR
jgi:hypothetical protein